LWSKLATPESPPPTYDSAIDLAALSALTVRVLSRNTSAAKPGRNWAQNPTPLGANRGMSGE